MKTGKDKKKIISIVILTVGIVTLVVGVVFLILKLSGGAAVSDAEYLVEVGSWKLDGEHCVEMKCEDEMKCLGADGEPMVSCNGGGVIWNFTEIGKGTLTTNDHVNDYDFIWAIEDGKLKIETSWLYTIDNEYTYTLDKGSNTLVLDDDIKFVKAE